MSSCSDDEDSDTGCTVAMAAFLLVIAPGLLLLLLLMPPPVSCCRTAALRLDLDSALLEHSMAVLPSLPPQGEGRVSQGFSRAAGAGVMTTLSVTMICSLPAAPNFIWPRVFVSSRVVMSLASRNTFSFEMLLSIILDIS